MEEIAKRFDPELDRFDGKATHREFRWNWPQHIYPVKRRLTVDQALEVQKYINTITRQSYPYHIRWYMGKQLWIEFCEYYAVNPDINKALRYL